MSVPLSPVHPVSSHWWTSMVKNGVFPLERFNVYLSIYYLLSTTTGGQPDRWTGGHVSGNVLQLLPLPTKSAP